MREFAFELALCAHLEGRADALLSRQLGASVAGTRVIDVVEIEPGPAFAERVAITPHEIPSAAIEADVGAGEARYWRDCFDTSAEYARSVVDRAVEVGFFERERRSGREYVRQTARYPDWVGRMRGIENKPDLGRPGDLRLQLRRDVSLGLFDEVILATASYVTGAHLNRIPPEVGVWRFDPDTGDREVVREPTALDPDAWGLEILEEFPGRTDVRPVSPAAKARQRRRLAERAYGKGWRVSALPACANARAGERFGAGALPDCAWKGDLVHPAEDCGAGCPGYEPADPPPVDVDAERARRSPWNPAPTGTARRQSGLDRFLSD